MVLTDARCWKMSRTWSTPSSTNEAGLTWMPFINAFFGAAGPFCQARGDAPATVPATAAAVRETLFLRNARRELLGTAEILFIDCLSFFIALFILTLLRSCKLIPPVILFQDRRVVYDLY